MQAGRTARVPVGMGIVVPSQKILDTLEQEELREMRKRIKADRERRAVESAASPDSALPLAATSDAELVGLKSDENPDHREDFNRLVGAASKSKPKGDRT